MPQHITPHNRPLNVPALEALEAMTRFVPPDVRDSILAADFTDELSGLRELARRQRDPDDWQDVSKPKREIGDYVESQGFNVPRRFDSTEEALKVAKRGGKVIVRSEHPQEYDSFSGLLGSHVLDQEKADTISGLIERGLPESIALRSTNESSTSVPLVRYLQLTNQQPGEFFAELSSSQWEYQEGTNVMIAADDAIADRYHITGFNYGNGGEGGWIGNGQGVSEPNNATTQMPDELIDQDARAALIEQYEAIRQLPKFSARQCPLMEFQIGDDSTLWFLQYHKARPFRPSLERLSDDDYKAADGWVKAQGVRGALGSLVTLKTALWYPSEPRSIEPTYIPRGPEDASFDHHSDIGLSEYVSPNRIAYVTNWDLDSVYSRMADGHELRSRWFKPFAALSLGKEATGTLIPKELQRHLSDIIYHQNKMARVVLDFASDGLNGFVRLNPETEEQPILTQY